MTLQIDMSKVAGDTSRDLGAQIGELTAELHAQRQANELLHRENAELREQIERGTSDSGEEPSPT